eukprot:TRINITY_DN40194_c0_g1_i1.p1 TRINITY_DN40194_c0_g1~~TRINITY_DN40194_c0_g1_i1.p1  ORF type:complete len:110 (+),score=14.94 TRINITY_DN40194_c0_g1_i1:194-523(+)
MMNGSGGGGGSNSPDLGLSPSSSTSPGLRPSAPAANGARLPPSGARRMPTTSPAPHIVGTFVNNSPNKGLPPRTPRHVSPGTGLNPSSPYRLPRPVSYTHLTLPTKRIV